MSMIGESLKRLRDDLNYSQGGMAASVGMRQTTWSGWENDPPEALEWLVRLSRRHGVSIDYILGETNNPRRVGDIENLSLRGLQLIEHLNSMSTHQQNALLEISRILKEIEANAQSIAAHDLMQLAMKYTEKLFGEDAAEEFYQSVDFLRRTGDDSALTAWLARYLGDDDTEGGDQ